MEEPLNGNTNSEAEAAAAALATADSEEEPMVGPGPPVPRVRRKRPLQFEQAYLDSLPSANMYLPYYSLPFSLSSSFSGRSLGV